MERRLTRGAIYMARFPPPDKERPVLIITRDGALGLLAKVTVVPVTSTIRGVGTEVRLDVEDGMKGPCVANFLNTVTVPKTNLLRFVSTLGEEKMAELCRCLRYTFGCE